MQMLQCRITDRHEGTILWINPKRLVDVKHLSGPRGARGEDYEITYQSAGYRAVVAYCTGAALDLCGIVLGEPR